jgi:hypothetical protein
MENLKFSELEIDELTAVDGGRYYGNGVYVNGNQITIDWSEVWISIANNLVASL